MEEKIYCKRCKYFDGGSYWRDGECKRFCKTIEYDTYLEHIKETECEYCEDINENNNCKYYKKKNIF